MTISRQVTIHFDLDTPFIRSIEEEAQQKLHQAEQTHADAIRRLEEAETIMTEANELHARATREMAEAEAEARALRQQVKDNGSQRAAIRRQTQELRPSSSAWSDSRPPSTSPPSSSANWSHRTKSHRSARSLSLD